MKTACHISRVFYYANFLDSLAVGLTARNSLLSLLYLAIMYALYETHRQNKLLRVAYCIPTTGLKFSPILIML